MTEQQQQQNQSQSPDIFDLSEVQEIPDFKIVDASGQTRSYDPAEVALQLNQFSTDKPEEFKKAASRVFGFNMSVQQAFAVLARFTSYLNKYEDRVKKVFGHTPLYDLLTASQNESSEVSPAKNS